MLTLQETFYMRLTPIERKQLPEQLQKSIENKLASRIQKIWRYSLPYRLNLIRKQINENKAITKEAVIFALAKLIYIKKLSITDFTEYLHNQFCGKTKKILTNEQMDTVLTIFKLNNDAHKFFSNLHGFCTKADEICMKPHGLRLILLAFDKDTLLEMYRGWK